MGSGFRLEFTAATGGGGDYSTKIWRRLQVSKQLLFKVMINSRNGVSEEKKKENRAPRHMSKKIAIALLYF